MFVAITKICILVTVIEQIACNQFENEQSISNISPLEKEIFHAYNEINYVQNKIINILAESKQSLDDHNIQESEKVEDPAENFQSRFKKSMNW